MKGMERIISLVQTKSSSNNATNIMKANNKRKQEKNIKKKYDTGTTTSLSTSKPSLEDFYEVVNQAINFKGKDAAKFPLLCFLCKYHTLGSRWLLRLLSPGKNDNSKEYLTAIETQHLGYLGTLLAGSNSSGWDVELSYAFGATRITTRAAKRNYYNKAFVLSPIPQANETPKEANKLEPEESKFEIDTCNKISSNSIEAATSSNSSTNTSGDSPTQDWKRGAYFSTPSRPSPVALFDMPFETPDKELHQSECQAGNTQKRARFMNRVHQLFGSTTQSDKAALGINTGRITASARKFAQKFRSHFASEQQVDAITSVPTAVGIVLAHVIENDNIEDAALTGIAVEIFRKAKASQPSNVFQVKYRTPDSKSLRTKMFVELPVPRKLSTNALLESKQQQLRRRSNLLFEIVQQQCGVTELLAQQQVVESLVEKRMQGRLDWEEAMVTIEDVVAIREMARGISTNMIVTILSSLAKLLDKKKMFPSQMRQKISALEPTLPEVAYYLVEAEIGKSETGMCVFYFAKCVPFLLESLVASCIIEGKQQDSFSFSTFKDYHIFFRGIDKGGDDVTDMTRYGNRHNGNSGEYCIPLSVLEGAQESYANLKKTTLSEARSRVMEPLHQRRLHILEIHFQDALNVLVPRNVSCIMVQFASTMHNFHPNLLSKVDVDLMPTRMVTEEESKLVLASAEIAKARAIVGTVQLHNEMLQAHSTGDFTTNFYLQLIGILQLDDDNDDSDEDGNNLQLSYLGFSLYRSHDRVDGNKLYSFRFEAPIVRSFDKTIVSTNCKRVLSINCDDGKLTTAVCGLGYCSSSYSCPRCIRRIDSRKFPEWAHQEYSDLVGAANSEKFDLREGKYSYESCYNTFKILMGENKQYSSVDSKIAMSTTEKVKSVTSIPLRTIQLDYQSGEPMHLGMGLVSHLNKEALKMLQAVLSNDN